MSNAQKAIAALVEIVENEDVDPDARIRAAYAILDRPQVEETEGVPA